MATIEISADELLLSALRQGEERAFQMVIKRFLHPLRYYAWTFVKRREVAEEIAYDSFMKLWQARHRFETLLKVKHFLYLVTKRACLDHLKAAHTKLGQSLEEKTDLIASELDLEARLIQTELMEVIYQEINKLPKKQREVFRLSFLEGMTAEEIGLQLGISLNAVYLNKSLATKFLQKIFKNKSLWLYVCFLIRFGEQ